MYSIFTLAVVLLSLLIPTKGAAQIESLRAADQIYNEQLLSEFGFTVNGNGSLPAYVTTDFFGQKKSVASSEAAYEQLLFPKLKISSGISYDFGRDNPLLTIQDYVPNTSELSYSGGIEFSLTNRTSLELNYQWTGELEIGQDPSFSIGGPSLASLSVSRAWQNWELNLSAGNLFNSAWDGSIFDLENQEPGEFKASEEVLYRPEKSISFLLTVVYWM